MSTPEQTQQALQTQEKPRSLQAMIEASARELGRALPEHMRSERLVRIALTSIRTNPDLAKCTPESFLGALFTSAQLGIEPIAGRAYLIPFNNNRKKPDGSWHTVKECEFVIGYKGLVDLFYRHEKAINIEWGVVKEGDVFDYEKGTASFLTHRESKIDGAPTKGFWVMANLVNGGKPFHYMTTAECLAHGQKHSKSWVSKVYDKKLGKKVDCDPHFIEGSPWADDPDSMCLKTVLVQLCKILPLSVELQTAIAQDETSRDLRTGVDNVLDIPSQVDWDAVEKETNDKLEKELSKEENTVGGKTT